MPTAAKLIGAVLFAALAYYVSDLVKVYLPLEGAGATLLSPVNAFFGAVMGWRIMGRHAGQGFMPAMGFGLTTIFAITFWALLIWSAYEMIKRAVRGRYDGPVEALLALSDLMLENAFLIVEAPVVAAAVIGSLLVALVTEFFARRWS
ncbi:MAG: TrgA family protein [Pseudomonadota bacterium]